jgi:hypothetical protein
MNIEIKTSMLFRTKIELEIIASIGIKACYYSVKAWVSEGMDDLFG